MYTAETAGAINRESNWNSGRGELKQRCRWRRGQRSPAREAASVLFTHGEQQQDDPIQSAQAISERRPSEAAARTRLGDPRKAANGGARTYLRVGSAAAAPAAGVPCQALLGPVHQVSVAPGPRTLGPPQCRSVVALAAAPSLAWHRPPPPPHLLALHRVRLHACRPSSRAVCPTCRVPTQGPPPRAAPAAG